MYTVYRHMDTKTKRLNLGPWHVTACQICSMQLAFSPEFSYSQNKYAFKEENFS